MAECAEEAEVLDATIKKFVRAVAEARDVSLRCDKFGEFCEMLPEVEREEVDAETNLYRDLMSFTRCLVKKRGE
jgi:uncharacterized UPF0160 family protein